LNICLDKIIILIKLCNQNKIGIPFLYQSGTLNNFGGKCSKINITLTNKMRPRKDSQLDINMVILFG